jgi:hypothetical protein
LTRDENVSPRESHCAHLLFRFLFDSKLFIPTQPPESSARSQGNPARLDLPPCANKQATAASPWLEGRISKWLLLWSAAVLPPLLRT